MQNLKIKNAMTDLINLVIEEECLNVEYSIESIIEKFQYELKQEILYQEYLENKKY